MRRSAIQPRPTGCCAGARVVARVAVLAALVGAVTSVGFAAQSTSVGPSLQFREASGCGGLVLYAWNDARTEVLVIRVDQSAVTIKNGTTNLEIGPASPAVTAVVEVSDTPRDTFPYCDQDAKATERPALWKVVSAKVKLIVKRRPGAAFTPVSVGVGRLVVQGPDGRQAKQRRDIQFTAAIGDLK